MRKDILFKLKGQIQVKCIVSDGNLTGTYTGNAQTSKYNNQNDLFKNAVYDCIYQFMRQGGKSSPNVKIIDYKMNYIGEKQGLVKIKRVKRKGKYYTYAYDGKTNKILTYKKWGYERNLNKFV